MNLNSLFSDGVVMATSCMSCSEFNSEVIDQVSVQFYQVQIIASFITIVLILFGTYLVFRSKKFSFTKRLFLYFLLTFITLGTVNLFASGMGCPRCETGVLVDFAKDIEKVSGFLLVNGLLFSFILLIITLLRNGFVSLKNKLNL